MKLGRLSFTFALGGASLVLFLLLAATGALLLTAYEPSPERAYGTVTALVDDVRFGAFVRNVHHWAANGLVLAAFAARESAIPTSRSPAAISALRACSGMNSLARSRMVRA